MDFFYLQRYVDSEFAKGTALDSEKVAKEFLQSLQDNYSDADFEKLLIISGYIPDLYAADSSEETLYTKLIEALVGEWARRIGATGELIKEKASREDVKITIAKKIVVCDAKSFRLGRSQQAPNAKDFLKLEDIRKWMDRYSNSIGGLVTYPCKHEWKVSSDIYQYCSTKDAPTLMLPYKYLALILHYKDNFTDEELLGLWDYERLFPEKLPKKIQNGNKKLYWQVINAEMIRILKISAKDLADYMSNVETMIVNCVKANYKVIEEIKAKRVKHIAESVEREVDIEKLKKEIINYKVQAETSDLDDIMTRMVEWRM